MQKIYLKTRPKNIEELLKLFFSYPTYNGYSGIETFVDKDCKQMQCISGKLRSFDELYFCAKTYFPNITPKRLIHELTIIKINKNNKLLSFRMFTCSTMKKIRVCISNNFQDFETATTINSYNSLWSWKELFNMIDIKSQKELDIYRKKYEKILIIK